MIRMINPGLLTDKHIHLCRAGTIAKEEYFAHRGLSRADIYNMSLQAKQDVVGILHDGPAYKEDELRKRMAGILKVKSEAGEREFWAPIDTSPDVGLMPLRVANELKAEFPGLKTGIYPIFGFCSERDGLARYKVILEACKEGLGDFICGLPERDARKGHELIAKKWNCQNGFDAHIKILLELGCKYHLPLQIHLDQVNSPQQHDTESVLAALRWLDQPVVQGLIGPTVEFVHVISPSCYDEERFQKLVADMKRYNIGLVCCPMAGLSMRQLPCYEAPVHNCLARIFDMRAAGVPVRFGTDNIQDHLVPIENPYMQREIETVANTLRFYLEDVLTDMVNGIPLNNVQLSRIEDYLEENRVICSQHQAAMHAAE
jgi:hypothetical protein